MVRFVASAQSRRAHSHHTIISCIERVEDGSHAVDSFARGRSEAMAWWCAASLHGWLLLVLFVCSIWRYRRCPFFAGRVLGKLKFVHICFKIMNVHRNQYELFPCCPRNLKLLNCYLACLCTKVRNSANENNNWNQIIISLVLYHLVLPASATISILHPAAAALDPAAPS